MLRMKVNRKYLNSAVILQILATSAFFSILGCSELTSKKSESYKYRIPWSDGNGGMSFQDIAIDDLNNPFVMQGASAKVIATGDYSVMTGPSGEVAEPNFIKSGTTLIPTDTLSVSAVTAYAHMNRIKKLDKKLGILDLLKWPRTVGVNTIHEYQPGYYSVNNAFYSVINDTINILPYIHNGLPLSLNGNTIAHEHFHSVFHNQVNWARVHFDAQVNLNNSSEFICEDTEFYQNIVNNLSLSKESGLTEETRSSLEEDHLETKSSSNLAKIILQANYVIARAWDEGSADFYSYLYDKNENFLEVSFPDTNNYFRNLSGHYQVALRRKVEVVSQLKSLNDSRCKNKKEKKPKNIKSNTPLRFENETSYYYQMGSDFAKFLRRLSDTTIMQDKYGKESLQKIVLAMIKTLPKVDAYLKINYHESIMSPLQFIRYILQYLEVERDPEVCKMTYQLYGSDYCGLSDKDQEGV